MFDEPRKHPAFMVLLGLMVVGSVPFLFVGSPLRVVFGLPGWLWWSILFTAGLSLVTAWGILRYWRDDRFD